jgi:hypothetical protein
VGRLEVLERLEMEAPKDEMCKFLVEPYKMNFERFMKRMKRDMDWERVTDDLRVGCIGNWFGGVALEIVWSEINHGIDAATILSDIEESLKRRFGSKKFDAEEMLTKVAKGKLIARGYLEDVRAFILDLECKFDLASGYGKEAIFEQESIYRDILSTRLPHLITKWNEKFGGGRKEWTFKAFTVY